MFTFLPLTAAGRAAMIKETEAKWRKGRFPMNFLRRWMYGRNGVDQLGIFTLLLYLLLDLVCFFAGWWPLTIVLSLLAFLFLYRVISRNLPRRRQENEWFLARLAPLRRFFRRRRLARTDKAHCYFKCPSCGQQLRVPRGNGRVRVTCRTCGASFEKKS